MTGLDRAAVALGVVSVASVGVAELRDKYQVLELRTAWSIAVAVGLGLCAVLAGLTRRRWAAAATGGLFVAAAVVQVPVWASSDNWLGGNGSTASLWLGLGAGLLAVGLAERLWPDPE
jgi:membrane protease YdiL (CAAX protease family)